MKLGAREKLGLALKGARLIFNAFFSSGPGSAGNSTFWSGVYPFAGQLPGSQVDWKQETGDLHRNPVVSICLDRIVSNFHEPVFQVYKPGPQLATGDDKILPDHPLAQLITRPNPYYPASGLWAPTILGFCCYGNAFWFKSKDGAGVVRELYPLFPWEVRPCYDDSGRQFIKSWQYLANGAWIDVPFDSILHFRNGIDPLNPRWGISPLEALMREIAADNEGSTWLARQMKQGGAKALLLSPASDMTEFTPEDAAALKAQVMANTTGDQRGMPVILSSTTKVDSIGLSPAELDIGTLRVIPEDRICAGMKVPVEVAGITSSGGKSTFDNYGQAIQQFYDMCLRPLQSVFAETIEFGLLPEVGGDPNVKCRWNYSLVLALQPAFDDAAKTWRLSYRAGVTKLNEARVMMGLPSMNDAEGDKLFVEPELLSPRQQSQPGSTETGRAGKQDSATTGGSQGLVGDEESDVEREAS